MLHDVRFPNEPDEYRQARDQLLQAEIDLRRQTEAVAAKRRELPLGGEIATDYEFEEWDRDQNAPRSTRMSELFAPGKDTLFLYSHMYFRGDDPSPGVTEGPLKTPCPACTSIIDAVDGDAEHIAQRINIAVTTNAPLELFREHSARRGWRHIRLLSGAGNTYNVDYQAEDAAGNQLPLATVFVKRDGKIHHFWSSELWMASMEDGQGPRHVDFLWPLWSVFDTTPEGRGDFHSSLSYS
jgi:predicted dithiol-disulfide oxidoreductase (DUF899 family)